MSAMRGVVLIALGLAALVRGWMLHGRPHTLLAYGLGFAALALGAWHLMRRPDAPRR
ncbi:MAG TPA: hypothetical protein VG893_09375 [Terracidiphilus sp.]|nr:hypothetical protein [Terracidiphilus sp.]